jgi:hypothetical protein
MTALFMDKQPTDKVTLVNISTPSETPKLENGSIINLAGWTVSSTCHNQ